MAQDKNYNSVPYKRIIDLGKLDTAGVSDILRVWNVASGSEKVISLENLVAGNITPVTIGTPANGLAIDSEQVLTIGLASTSTTGVLSSTDWNTFNNKPSSYITLNDTTDLDFISKNGYVPVVVGESSLALQPLPQVAENGLISGGIVQWTGTGYVFNVSGSFYRIGGNPYESDPTQKTLSAPDPTNNRIDVFAVDINGLVVVIEGTPSATPVKPQINPQTQLELTSVIVTAASTAPTLTEEIIYDQNIEWTGSSAGTGTANFASTVSPYQGTVSVETTNIQDAFYIQFDNGIPIDVSGYQTLGFQLKLKASMPANQNITGVFLDNSGNPASSSFNLSFDKSSTAYQFVGLVLSSLIFSDLDARYLRFTFNRSGGSPTYSGYFLDILKLEGGINPPQTVGSFTGLNDTPNSYSGQAGKSVAVKSDESGLEFVTGGGGASTFLALTDTPSAYVAQANKFPRVNVGETALAFDTISPYDLDQEGALDAQVLTWVSANSRYEPITPSGGTITGLNTHVMFFDGANNPAGDSGFTYIKANKKLIISDTISVLGGDFIIDKSVGSSGTVFSTIRNRNTNGETANVVRNDTIFSALSIYGSAYSIVGLRNNALLSVSGTSSVLAIATLGASSIDFRTNAGFGADNTRMRIHPSGQITINSLTELGADLGINGLLRVFNSTFSGYNSGGGANDSLKLASSNLGAGFAVQNTNASGFSGIEYMNQDAAVKVFTGFNNGNGQEFRFNNIATGGYINFITGGATRIQFANSGNINIGTTTDIPSALMNLTSTSKGLLLPRMTGAQAESIATPPDGLMVYINNGNGATIISTGFWGRDASSWVKLN